MAGVKGMKGGGGRRVGAGRKPIALETLAVRGGQSRRPGAASGVPSVPVTAAEALPVVECPRDLPAYQRAIWEALAPHATTERTLTPATAMAFRDLCEAIAVKRAMLAQIQVDGMTSDRVSLQIDEAGGGLQSVEPKAHPLIAKWTALMVRCEAGMARFRVTADGKPDMAASVAAPVKVNPLLRFIAK